MEFDVDTPAYEVLFFVNSDCPIARRYSPEMSRIAKSYGSHSKFRLVYCDSNKSQAELKSHHKEFGFTMRFDTDPKHSLAKKMKIEVVPTALVLENGKRVVYRGRIDDAYGSDFKWRKPKQFDLRNVLDSIRLGKSVKFKETRPVGCTLSN